MSFRQSRVLQSGSRSEGPLSARQRGVYDICHDHIRELSGLPGELSEFEENGIGYEWRCQLSLGACACGQVLGDTPCIFQLQFSLMDLEGRARPVAVLYLVEQAQLSDWQERILLSMETPGSAHDQVTHCLLPLGVDIEFMQKAGMFLEALEVVRSALGPSVRWV